MLLLGIFVVPQNAALAHFDKAAVNVVGADLHYFAHFINPTEIIKLSKFLPSLFVSRSVEIS